MFRDFKLRLKGDIIVIYRELLILKLQIDDHSETANDKVNYYKYMRKHYFRYMKRLYAKKEHRVKIDSLFKTLDVYFDNFNK